MKKIAAALLILVGTQASAWTSFGAPDCGTWVNAKRSPDRAWLLGFLSGINSVITEGKAKGYDPLDKLSTADQAYVWMDNYCRNNPLKGVVEGGIELYFEIQKK